MIKFFCTSCGNPIESDESREFIFCTRCGSRQTVFRGNAQPDAYPAPGAQSAGANPPVNAPAQAAQPFSAPQTWDPSVSEGTVTWDGNSVQDAEDNTVQTDAVQEDVTQADAAQENAAAENAAETQKLASESARNNGAQAPAFAVPPVSPQYHANPPQNPQFYTQQPQQPPQYNPQQNNQYQYQQPQHSFGGYTQQAPDKPNISINYTCTNPSVSMDVTFCTTNQKYLFTNGQSLDYTLAPGQHMLIFRIGNKIYNRTLIISPEIDAVRIYASWNGRAHINIQQLFRNSAFVPAYQAPGYVPNPYAPPVQQQYQAPYQQYQQPSYQAPETTQLSPSMQQQIQQPYRTPNQNQAPANQAPGTAQLPPYMQQQIQPPAAGNNAQPGQPPLNPPYQPIQNAQNPYQQNPYQPSGENAEGAAPEGDGAEQ